MIKTVKHYEYDDKFGVLYITFSDTSNSYGDEKLNGIVWLRDMDTEEITGLTIFFNELENINKMENLFIRTYDKEQADKLAESGFRLLSEDEGLYYFLHKPVELNFTFESIGVDRKKIELTNDLFI